MIIHFKINRVFILAIVFLSSLHFVKGQYIPENHKTDYLENYRGQFHFSPKSEWMNDINGLVYQGGKYHMIYQWGKAIRHGGYATSLDLLHWEDRGVAQIPQKSFLPIEAKRNASGDQIYSGSAVVVSGQTAKKITGSEKEAIIFIYTGTSKGTCLSWSNDCGNTWHDYTGNPVANPTTNANPRDPRVFWHKPTSKWIMAIYEKGTTFYSSDDLIKWDYLSNIDFGFECPDVFQLPLNGDVMNKKWVLLDANGSYLVGEFNGKTFIKDQGQKAAIMDFGPDFYAAQTFAMEGLPNNDKRIIQIAWMDHWNGGIGEQGWERNATFPVSLGLITLNGQKVITRNPINEISSLYESTKKWDNQILKTKKNLLNGIKSKKFELTLEVDLNDCKALTFGIKVANKYIIYDVHNKTLLSKELLPDASNHVSIKILVDWGQLEVFANNGIFSYSHQFAFSPDHNNIELFSDGDIKLVSMQFHELARIW